MAVATDDFKAWIEQAGIPASRLTPELEAVLQSVFRFRQQQGTDYYSTRLLSHYLLHADTKLKVAQIARLLGISRPNASKHKKLSSKEAIQQAHHRMDGRPSGKLLPRFAGPIAAFLLSHPGSSRADLLDFIEHTCGVCVSRVALHKFLKKYGLNEVTRSAQASAQPPAVAKASVDTAAPSSSESPSATVAASAAAGVVAADVVAPAPMLVPAPAPAPAPVIELASALGGGQPSPPPFCTGGRNTAAPSC